MAKLISTNQRLVTGVKNPGSSYSRVVTCIAYIKGTPDARGYTTPLGEKLWLHRVDVWAVPDHLGVVGASLSFRILHGTGKPATAAEIKKWTNILPVYWPDGIGREWSMYQAFKPMHWDMEQLFEGAAQRFGIWLEVSGFVSVLEFFASFKVSEG